MTKQRRNNFRRSALPAINNLFVVQLRYTISYALNNKSYRRACYRLPGKIFIEPRTSLDLFFFGKFYRRLIHRYFAMRMFDSFGSVTMKSHCEVGVLPPPQSSIPLRINGHGISIFTRSAICPQRKTLTRGRAGHRNRPPSFVFSAKSLEHFGPRGMLSWGKLESEIHEREVKET